MPDPRLSSVRPADQAEVEPEASTSGMLVDQRRASGYQYDLNHSLRWFFYFTPDLRKTKSSHQPASGEE